MTAANIHYEIADRTRATATGGIRAMHLLVRKLELDQLIDRHLGLLKIHLPYHDSDHVLNIAYNLVAEANTPLEQVGTMIGVKQRPYFTIVFRQHFGCIPAQYRRKS